MPRKHFCSLLMSVAAFLFAAGAAAQAYPDRPIKLESEPVKSKLVAQGQVVQALPLAEFAKGLDSDIARWKTVIETARITIE